MLVERERMRQRMLHALEALSCELRTRARHAEAVEVALTAVAAEPLRESAHRVLVEAHVAQGNQIEARRSFARYRDLVRRELGVSLSPELAVFVGRASSRPVQQGDQLGRRLRVELIAQPVAVGDERPPSLHPVAFGQVRLDQHPLRALPQRLGGDRGQRHVDRLRASPLVHEAATERLQRVQHAEAHPLPLGQRPVVVPARQQVQGFGQAAGTVRSASLSAPVISRRAHAPISVVSTVTPSPTCSDSLSAASTGMSEARNRQSVERRFPAARLSPAVGHSSPAT